MYLQQICNGNFRDLAQRLNILITMLGMVIKIGCYTFLLLRIQSVQLLRIYTKKAQKSRREKNVLTTMRKEEKLWVLCVVYISRNIIGWSILNMNDQRHKGGWYEVVTAARGKHLLCLSEFLFLGDELLDLKGSHTAATCTGDGLTVAFVLNVTSSEDTLHRCLGGSRHSDDVAVTVSLELRAEDRSRGFMTW